MFSLDYLRKSLKSRRFGLILDQCCDWKAATITAVNRQKHINIYTHERLGPERYLLMWRATSPSCLPCQHAAHNSGLSAGEEMSKQGRAGKRPSRSLIKSHLAVNVTCVQNYSDGRSPLPSAAFAALVCGVLRFYRCAVKKNEPNKNSSLHGRTGIFFFL